MYYLWFYVIRYLRYTMIERFYIAVYTLIYTYSFKISGWIKINEHLNKYGICAKFTYFSLLMIWNSEFSFENVELFFDWAL